MVYLIDFLLLINNYESVNKMTKYNLAVCFAPCLLRAETVSMADVINIGKMVSAIKIMMDYKSQIFIPKQLEIDLGVKPLSQYPNLISSTDDNNNIMKII